MERYRNFMRHGIRLRPPEQEERILRSEGDASVTEQFSVLGTHDGVELRLLSHTDIVGLPPPEQGVRYVVSLAVLQANARLLCPRQDLVAPDTGPSCFRENDVIKAITGFVTM